MAKKKNKIKKWILGLAVLAIILAAYFYLSYYFNSEMDKYNKNYSDVTLEKTAAPSNIKQKDDTLSSLREFTKYGDWPIGTVTLSPSRGNPFQDKNIQQ